MHKIYDITYETDGEQKHEILLIAWTENDLDISYVLHKLGLDYAMSTEGLKKCGNTGLSYNEFLSRLTPEMLEPYKVKMMRLSQMATHMNDDDMLVSLYELKSHLLAEERNKECMRTARETSKRFARNLGRLKDNRHQLISKWDNARLNEMATSWGHQYARTGEQDPVKFFEKKLSDAIHRAYISSEGNMNYEQNASQDASENVPENATTEQTTPQT